MKNCKRIVFSTLAVVVLLSMLAAQCAAPVTLETVVETVVVKETVEVEKEVVKEVEVVITATPEPVAERPAQITLVDTNSGANFQWYWQNQVTQLLKTSWGSK